MATISEVARLAGVSTATVSRVVNSPDVVNAETRRLVETAIAELDYKPKRATQTNQTQAPKTIGIVVNCFASPYFGQILDGADKTLQDLGFNIVAETSHSHSDGQSSAWQSLAARNCDGIIVHADLLPEAKLAELLVQFPKTVLINRDLPGFHDRCVGLDNVTAGQMAARHLVSHGHRKIATVTGPVKAREFDDRQIGFIRGLAEGHVTLPFTHVFQGDLTVEGGYEAMRRLLSHNLDVSAIFFHNDFMAIGAVKLCWERGVRVPEDISIIGFDDIDAARYVAPQLSSLRQPTREIGVAAAKLAYALATDTDGSSVPNLFDAELISRESVARREDVSADPD